MQGQHTPRVRGKGSVYKVKGGYGIRWLHEGTRLHKSPFHSPHEARAWYMENVYPTLDVGGAVLHDACKRIRDWARRPANTPDARDSWVYVIAAPDVQRIKIGRTTMPMRRLRAHATSAPVPLTALLMMPGGAKLEAALLKHTEPFACVGAGREWRTIEALEVVVAFLRERAGDRRPAHETGVRSR
jgi:hypothetical protein